MLIALLAASLSLSHDDRQPFVPALIEAGGGEVVLEVSIADGHAVYADRTRVEAPGAAVQVLTAPVVKVDPVTGRESLWRDRARWAIRGVSAGQTIDVVVQGCSEVDQVCFPAKRFRLQVGTPR